MTTHEIVARRAPHAPARDVANWLGLAAMPTFAGMALLTGAFGGPSDMLCAMIQGASPLSGMVPMYLLMSAFHSGPWLRLTLGKSRDTFEECRRYRAAICAGAASGTYSATRVEGRRDGR
jgi:hypothetical protein